MKQGTKPSDAAHEVGYGKPPKATRFRKGRSGNPKGRQRGDKNLISVFKCMAKKQIKIREGYKLRTITMADAIEGFHRRFACPWDCRCGPFGNEWPSAAYR